MCGAAAETCLGPRAASIYSDGPGAGGGGSSPPVRVRRSAPRDACTRSEKLTRSQSHIKAAVRPVPEQPCRRPAAAAHLDVLVGSHHSPNWPSLLAPLRPIAQRRAVSGPADCAVTATRRAEGDRPSSLPARLHSLCPNDANAHSAASPTPREHPGARRPRTLGLLQRLGPLGSRALAGRYRTTKCRHARGNVQCGLIALPEWTGYLRRVCGQTRSAFQLLLRVVRGVHNQIFGVRLDDARRVLSSNAAHRTSRHRSA